MPLLAVFEPRRGSVAHRFPPQPVPPPRPFYARCSDGFVDSGILIDTRHFVLLFSAYLDGYRSAAWSVEFAKEDTLPGPQCH